jgi:hypothetical protein
MIRVFLVLVLLLVREPKCGVNPSSESHDADEFNEKLQVPARMNYSWRIIVMESGFCNRFRGRAGERLMFCIHL